MIEKSLTAPRKKKVKGQLHKLAYITDKEAKLLQKFGGQKVMTPEKIPAYPPPGERGGPGSGAEGRSPGGGGGGGGGERAMAANIAAAAARSRAAAAESAAKAKRDMQATIAKAEKAEAARVATPISGGESMARFGTPVYAGTTTKVADDMISRGEGKTDEDAREKFISQQYIKPRNIYEGTDLEEQREIDRIRAERNLQFNPNLSRDERQNLEVGLGLREPKQSSGFLKGLGTLAASVFLPAILPAKAAAAYKVYNTAKTASAFAKKFGVTDTDVVQSLTKNVLNKDILKQTLKDDKPKVADRHPGTGKKKRTTTDDRGDGVNRILPESLQSTVSEGTQQFLSDEQKEQYLIAQNKMKAALAEGYYVDSNGKQIALDDEQINALTQFITKIDSLLVDPVMMADGGRVDKAFGGRVRDI
jgi:hypothetical protein